MSNSGIVLFVSMVSAVIGGPIPAEVTADEQNQWSSQRPMRGRLNPSNPLVFLEEGLE